MEDEIFRERICDLLEQVVQEMKEMNVHLYAIGCEIQPIAEAIDPIGIARQR